MSGVLRGQATATVSVQDDGVPRVSATATRASRIAPDKVTLYAVVEGAGENAPEAGQKAERKIQALTDALKQLNARVDVVTALPYGVMAAPNYGGYPGQTSSNPFVGRYVVRVQPQRVDQTMTVASALMNAGAANVMPMFEAAAADAERRTKFSEALAQARADAEALAAGLGMRLGALIEVTSTPGPANFNVGQPFLNFGRGMDFAGPAQMPEIQVIASVTVRYRLQAR